MEQFGLALILFAAFWVGCAAGYIAMRLRAQVAYERGRNESAAEISALQERLNGRDQQYNEARARAEAGVETTTRLEAELRQETDRRTVAEARLSLLPKYEAELDVRGNKIGEQQRELTQLHVAVSELNARLEESKKTAEDKINAIQALQSRVAESFQSMSAEALVSNNKAFLELAGDALARLQDSAKGDLDHRQTQFGAIMEPLKSSLDRVDARISELEKERATAYAGLQQQVESMMRTQASLQAETSHLASALRTPSSRGRWGEVQLRRVVELAGMISHCDFVESHGAAEGGASRPDVIVQLPNQRQIVVDSKVSLAAYLEANDATDEIERSEKRRRHAAEVRAHVEQLSAKGYWDQFPQSPEFVVAFLPGEAFFSAALEHDPELLEFGVERRVILATPTTLIALLRAVAWGWKQELVSTNAKEIRDLGKALYDRLRGLAENFTEVQRSLTRTTVAFNRTVGSFESSVMPAARRLRELGASTGDEIVSLPPVDTTPRSLHLLAEATEQVEDTKMMALGELAAVGVAAVAKPVVVAEVAQVSPVAPAITARVNVPAVPAVPSVPAVPATNGMARPAETVVARSGRPNGIGLVNGKGVGGIETVEIPMPPKGEVGVEGKAVAPVKAVVESKPVAPVVAKVEAAVAAVKPVVESKPVAVVVAEVKPVVESKPVAVVVAEVKPVVENKPVAPVVAVVAAPEAPVVEAKPVVENKPVAPVVAVVAAPEAPVVEVKPVVESKPVAPVVSVVAAPEVPVVESKPVVENKPVAPVVAVVAAPEVPVGESKPVVESKPVAVVAPVHEPKPVVENKPVAPVAAVVAPAPPPPIPAAPTADALPAVLFTQPTPPPPAPPVV
jgi:DNA recombination protein RmuC